MDTTFTAGLGIALVATVLLILISAAEAGIVAISRSRVRMAPNNGLSGLLHSYIRQRHDLLHVLSAGTTAMVVAATAGAVLLVAGTGTLSAWRLLVAALAALLGVALVRQTARRLAMINPEAAGLRLAFPTRLLVAVFGPLAWLASLPVRLILRLAGEAGDPPGVDPAEELLAVLEAVGEGDGADALAEERRMMRGILAMSSHTVREIMSPRMDLRAISTDASVGDVMRMITETGMSRIPLYGDSLDNIVGVIYAKDLLAYLQAGDLQPELRQIARPPYFVPETKRANELLADLRRDQVHMAIAVDEYGGTAGVVTVEDLLEEIVGEIVDEYDTDEVEVERVGDGEAIVDARLPLDELNELFGTEIDSEDFDTVGGLVLSLLGRLAAPGDQVESAEHGLRLRVLSILGRRIKKVRIERWEPQEEQAAAV